METADLTFRREVIDNWQAVVNMLAELLNVPAALIMRLVDDDIEVFLSSESEGNPYTPNASEHFEDSGLYCETVIKTSDKLLVPNALKDVDWENNPDVKLNMISYLGFPIVLPDKTPFGTICVLDNKTNAYSETYVRLLEKFRDLVQSHIWQIYMNQTLNDENKTLSDYIEEIRQLREIIPICSHCKKIRNDDNFWESVEGYFSKQTGSEFSHGICPDCMVRYYGDLKKEKSTERRKTKLDRRQRSHDRRHGDI